MAPAGHAEGAGSPSKAHPGRTLGAPRNRGGIRAGSSGYEIVTTPVRRLLSRAVSMAASRRGSSVGAGVAELEALVDQREVRDDRATGGERDRGPVRVARRPQVVAVHAPRGVG